jgi:hypothetical protein
MACGGLKSAERKIEQRLLNRHHSVRVTDFALEVLSYVKTQYLKNGKQLEVTAGIHTGSVISGVVGETKPQFSLIGDTVNKTARVCAKCQPAKVSVSKETKHFLELYTNNLTYQKTMVQMKGIGDEPIFTVSVASRVFRIIKAREAAKEGQMAQPMNAQANMLHDERLAQNGQSDSSQDGVEDYEPQQTNRDDDGEEAPDSQREMVAETDSENFEQEGIEAESNKSGMVDEGTMNVFGFSDDMNLDDRIIVQNASANQIYQVVERPKHLLTFENKDLEQEFLYQISKAESRKTTIFLALLIVLNKVVIMADIM